uniref:Uncharacterized protein n=1 Tax=Vespula pensylvanica TaxID=30213 RepID=A0A834NQ11_VESPE|nr:hypothetical protein H0235_012004 [Vespula pensylvanica]
MIGLSNVLRRLVIRKVPCRYDTEFFVGIEAGTGTGAEAGTGVEAVAGTRTEFTRLRVTYKLVKHALRSNNGIIRCGEYFTALSFETSKRSSASLPVRFTEAFVDAIAHEKSREERRERREEVFGAFKCEFKSIIVRFRKSRYDKGDSGSAMAEFGR